MKNNVYVISDRLTGRYGALFDSPTDESAKVFMLRRYGSAPDYPDLKCFRAGTVDIEEGVIIGNPSLAEVKLLPQPNNMRDKNPPINAVENSVE